MQLSVTRAKVFYFEYIIIRLYSIIVCENLSSDWLTSAIDQAQMKVNLATLKADNENLKSKIVQSPERFKGEVTRLNSAVQSLKTAKEERTKRLLELCDQQDSRLQYTEVSNTAMAHRYTLFGRAVTFFKSAVMSQNCICMCRFCCSV